MPSHLLPSDREDAKCVRWIDGPLTDKLVGHGLPVVRVERATDSWPIIYWRYAPTGEQEAVASGLLDDERFHSVV